MSEAPPRPPRGVDYSTGIMKAQEFEQCYKDAYKRIDKAVTFTAENKHEQAQPYYECGMKLLERAVTAKVSQFGVDDTTAKHYCDMQDKMRRTRKEVEQHFFNSQLFSGAVGGAGYPIADAPPSYDMLPDAQDVFVNYPNLPERDLTPSVRLPPKRPPSHHSLMGPTTTTTTTTTPTVTPHMSPQEGQLLFRIENGVQIFFIFPDGRVTSPSYPAFLEVVAFNSPLTIPGGSIGDGVAGGFLQVGEWSYPLLKASSPVLHSFYGAYMFPDPSNSVQGSHVGIIIPDSISKPDKELFESILIGMTSYQEQPKQSSKTVSHSIPIAPVSSDRRGSDSSARSTQSTTSEKIAAGAEALSSGVVWGAGKMSELITSFSERLQETSAPIADDPEAPQTKIDPKLQTTVKVARNVSGKAVKVSGYILGQVGKATLMLGRKVAPHLQHHGTRAISNVTGQSLQQSSVQVDGVLEVAAGAVHGASTVYMGLERAAETLARSLTHNTVNVVTHKYGSEAGKFTDDAMHAVSQSAMAGHNIAALGVKGVAKRAAKDTGKALVYSHKGKKVAVGEEAGDDVEEGMELGQEATEEGDSRLVVEQAQEVMEHDLPSAVVVPKDRPKAL